MVVIPVASLPAGVVTAVKPYIADYKKNAARMEKIEKSGKQRFIVLRSLGWGLGSVMVAAAATKYFAGQDLLKILPHPKSLFFAGPMLAAAVPMIYLKLTAGGKLRRAGIQQDKIKNNIVNEVVAAEDFAKAVDNRQVVTRIDAKYGAGHTASVKTAKGDAGVLDLARELRAEMNRTVLHYAGLAARDMDPQNDALRADMQQRAQKEMARRQSHINL